MFISTQYSISLSTWINSIFELLLQQNGYALRVLHDVLSGKKCFLFFIKKNKTIPLQKCSAVHMPSAIHQFLLSTNDL